MQKLKIIPIKLAITTCYIIQMEKTILIDCGPPRHEGSFFKKLNITGINPEKLDLIVVTHGHWDHVGSAQVIKERTKSKIAMHEIDKKYLDEGEKKLPNGVTLWGKIMVRLLRPFERSIKFTIPEIDYLLSDNGMSLRDFGIHGDIVHTPGHTSGSVSVVLESGEAFVGDLAMSGIPLRLKPGLPILAESVEQVEKSWQKLLDLGAKIIYPAHGRPFSAKVLENYLA